MTYGATLDNYAMNAVRAFEWAKEVCAQIQTLVDAANRAAREEIRRNSCSWSYVQEIVHMYAERYVVRTSMGILNEEVSEEEYAEAMSKLDDLIMRAEDAVGL